MTRWTQKDIERLVKEGHIRGYKVHKKSNKPATGGRKVLRHYSRRSKEKDWLSWNLLYWCNEHAVALEEEYRFHPDRKWRFDWAIASLKIGIEFEGLMSEKSRHTTVVGYSGDTDKYREAAKLGYTVLRYTVLNYKQVVADLNDILDKLKTCN